MPKTRTPTMASANRETTSLKSVVGEVWGVLDHYARSTPGAVDVEMPHELLLGRRFPANTRESQVQHVLGGRKKEDVLCRRSRSSNDHHSYPYMKTIRQKFCYCLIQDPCLDSVFMFHTKTSVNRTKVTRQSLCRSALQDAYTIRFRFCGTYGATRAAKHRNCHMNRL